MATILSVALLNTIVNASPQKAALILAQRFSTGYEIRFTRNGLHAITVTDTVLENNGRDGVWFNGSVVTGNATKDGMWKARISSTANIEYYAELDLSEQGEDGWIRSSLLAGATLYWSLCLRLKRKVPLGVYPLTLGKNKYGGYNSATIPAIDQAVAGQVYTSRLMKLYDVYDDVIGAAKWTGVSAGPSASDIEVSVNGAAYVNIGLNVVVSIVEGDTVQFKATAYVPTITATGFNDSNNTRTIYLREANGSLLPYLGWFFVMAFPRASAAQTFTVGAGQTYATPEALSAANVLRAGDTVHLLGQDFAGFKVRQSGSVAKLITWMTKPGEARNAAILGSLGYGQIFNSPGAQIENAGYVIWGQNLVSHQKFVNLDVSAGRGTSLDRTARFAFEQRGENWIYEGCKVYDSLMGFHSSDLYSGSSTMRLCWMDNIGQLSSFNSHPIYNNADVAAWPDLLSRVENCLFTNATGQAVAMRSCYSIVRNNWIEMNQDISNPNATDFWTITPNGSGGFNYSGGPQGSGLGGQFAVLGSAPSDRDNNYLYRQPVHQCYGNVIIGSINTGTISVGGDSAGPDGFQSCYVLHNTILLPADKSVYSEVFRSSYSPYATSWFNNLVTVVDNAVYQIESAWRFFGISDNVRWPYQVANSNILPDGSGVYWTPNQPAQETIGRYLHQRNTLWQAAGIANKPCVNQTLTAFNATLVAGTGAIGSAIPLRNPGSLTMPAYADPIDLTRRTWATRPVYPFSIPASGSVAANVGATI